MILDLIVVDGPNFFNCVTRYLTKTDYSAETIQGYLSDWFDADRLVAATLDNHNPPDLGAVIFHSGKALGRGKCRLDGTKTPRFWERQGSNPHYSCIAINIPGGHQDKHEFICRHCKRSNTEPSTVEKGIDTGITTYLFETMDRWNSVCVFTQDVDFMPPVLA